MGRGRAKAKQTKVARDLKYRSVNTDFESLERELRGDTYSYDEEPAVEETDVPDPYADLAEQYNEDAFDEDEDGRAPR